MSVRERRRPSCWSMSAAFVSAGLATSSAAAQMPIPCGDYREIVRQLAEKHGERAAGRGLSASGNLVELLRAEDGGWTLLMVLPNGRACLMSMGEAWQPIEAPRPGDEI